MKPSKANVKAHLDKIREVIKAHKTAKQANLIRLLNPVEDGRIITAMWSPRKPLLALMTVSGQCALAMGGTRAPEQGRSMGLRRNTLRPKAPGNGYLPPPKNKRMERSESSSCCKNRIRQYSGMSRLKPTRICMTPSGPSISSPDGANKC